MEEGRSGRGVEGGGREEWKEERSERREEWKEGGVEGGRGGRSGRVGGVGGWSGKWKCISKEMTLKYVNKQNI